MLKKDILMILDSLTEEFGSRHGFVSVDFQSNRGHEKFVVTFRRLPKSLHREHRTMQFGKRTVSLLLDFSSGPPILFDLDTSRMRFRALARSKFLELPMMGGDPIWHRDLSGYGTLGIALGYCGIEVLGKRCDSASPCVISNNHVIAQRNAGRRGDPVCGQDIGCTAMALHCFIPIGTADIALATITDPANIQRASIRSIGTGLYRVAEARIGEFIKKTGARSGYTEGRFTGLANIVVDGINYRGVCVESNGLSLPGDSGSIIVNRNNLLVGIHFAGERASGSSPRKGFFFSFATPSVARRSAGTVLGVSVRK